MAWYKHDTYIKKSNSDEFDKDHPPGNLAPHAGVYRCMGCGREIGIADGHVLPPQNHHSHTQNQGAIRWRLIVYADHRPASEQ
jgi:hypothetical protein